MDINDFKHYCLSMIEQKKKCDDISKKLKDENAVLDAMKKAITDHLTNFGLERFDTGDGLVYKVNKMNVKIADKNEFFNYLKTNNMLDELATVNFQTLNAFYKEKLEEAAKEGKTEFNLPGIQESGIYTTVQVRSNK
jgi:hypothetical protein